MVLALGPRCLQGELSAAEVVCPGRRRGISLSACSFKPVCVCCTPNPFFPCPRRGFPVGTRLRALYNQKPLIKSDPVLLLAMVLCDPEKQRGYKTAQFVARWADKAGLNTRLISSYVTSPSCKASDKASQNSIPVGGYFSQTEATLPLRGLLSFPLGVFKPLRNSDHLNRKLFLFLNDFF